MTAAPSAQMAGTIDVGGDLTVNRLGFGAMRITGEGIWGPPPDRDEAKRVLRRALEVGITFIDTADSYGPDVSEEIIAEALYPYPDELVIATKGGLVRAGPGQWAQDGRPEHLRAACEGSLRRLRLDQIPLYQMHRPDPKVPYEESIGTLVTMKEEGKIRHIGVSNVTEHELRRAMALTPVVSVQNRYNATDRSSESIVDLCEQEDSCLPPVGSHPGPRVDPGHNAGRVSPRRHPSSASAGLAPGPLTEHAAYSRDRHRAPPRRQRGRGFYTPNPGRGRRDHRRRLLTTGFRPLTTGFR